MDKESVCEGRVNLYPVPRSMMSLVAEYFVAKNSKQRRIWVTIRIRSLWNERCQPYRFAPKHVVGWHVRSVKIFICAIHRT